MVALSLRRPRALILAGRPPGAGRGRRASIAARSCRSAGRPTPARPVYSLRRGARTPTHGLGEVEPALLAARLPGFLEFFFAQMFTEPHSTKQIEDCVGWGLETDAET